MNKCIGRFSTWIFGTIGWLLVCLLLLIGGGYVYYEWFWQEWSPARIERITGIRVPKYNVIEYDQGERHFTGDFMDRYKIEFQTIPSEEMFDEIDRLIETGKTGWHKDGNEYTFKSIWGNGYPAPKGESDDEDIIFGITITKGEKQATIRHGMW